MDEPVSGRAQMVTMGVVLFLLAMGALIAYEGAWWGGIPLLCMAAFISTALWVEAEW